MSNDALLVNTQDGRAKYYDDDKPSEYIVVAEGVYRIPIPCFFCFQESDLYPFRYRYDEFEASLTIPFTNTKSALQNLNAAKSLMREICGDEEVADGYWEFATKNFVDFRYDYMIMNYLDIFHGAEWDDDAFRQCFSRTKSAFTEIKNFAGYDEKCLPYAIDEFYTKKPDLLEQDRNNNSAALDFGLVKPSHRFDVSSSVVESPSEDNSQRRPWWMFWR